VNQIDIPHAIVTLEKIYNTLH